MQLHIQDHSQPQSAPRPPRPSLGSQQLRQRLTPAEARQWSVAPQLQQPILPRLHPPTAPSVAPTSNHSLPGQVLGIGGWLVALCTVVLALGGFPSTQAQAGQGQHDWCETVVQPSATLSRVQLAQLLTVPERAPQSQIREQLAQPYCQLADLEVRAEVMAQREAYPLAFDPQTWLVLLFEGEEYAGYAFTFQS